MPSTPPEPTKTPPGVTLPGVPGAGREVRRSRLDIWVFNVRVLGGVARDRLRGGPQDVQSAQNRT